MKNHIKINKYKLFNPSLNDILNDFRKSQERPGFRLGYSWITEKPQPTSIEEKKKKFGSNEKYLRKVLPLFCYKINPETFGRPSKHRKVGRPSNKDPTPSNLNTKTRYQFNQEKTDKAVKEIIAIFCEGLEMTEIQFGRRCRMIVKKIGVNQLSSIAPLPLPLSSH